MEADVTRRPLDELLRARLLPAVLLASLVLAPRPGLAAGPAVDPLEEVLRTLPPALTLLAYERITLDLPDTKVFRAYSLVRKADPELLTDAELYGLAKVAFLSTRKTYGTLTRGDIHRAQEALRARGRGRLLDDVELRAAFLYVARTGEVTARLVKDFEEVLANEDMKIRIRTAQRCLMGLKEMNQALERRHRDRQPLPAGGVSDVLEVLRASNPGLEEAVTACPKDGAPYALERAATPPLFVCPNHEPPRKLTPLPPPVSLAVLAETNAVAWARMEVTRPVPAAPVPDAADR